MSLNDCVDYLLKEGYGMMVGNQFVITEKLNKSLSGVATVSNPVVGEVRIEPRFILRPVNAVTEDDRKNTWNKFIADANVPHRVNTGSSVYTVRQYNKPAANRLIEIINSPGIDYETLVKSTDHYYKTITYKVTLTKYLLNDVWKDEYTNYKSSNKSISNYTAGENRFED